MCMFLQISDEMKNYPVNYDCMYSIFRHSHIVTLFCHQKQKLVRTLYHLFDLLISSYLKIPTKAFVLGWFACIERLD